MTKKIIAIIASGIFLAGLCKAQKTVEYGLGSYSAGISSTKDQINVLSSDLVTLGIEYTYLIKIDKTDIPKIDSTIGPYYNDKICKPVIQSSLRKNFGAYTTEETITTKRDEITVVPINESKAILQEYHIKLEGIFIRDVILPPGIHAIMEEKLASEQEIMVKEYKTRIAQMESERLKVEAAGIARYNHMIDSSLTEKVLQMKYIEALTELAKSDNAKVVVIGNDKIKLPEIPEYIEKKEE
ncbi:MAG: hypothetical protein JW894_13410 [Bacteroidales bacterium]|nr:hypothetical protein [Bacteroidales bacterium]